MKRLPRRNQRLTIYLDIPVVEAVVDAPVLVDTSSLCAHAPRLSALAAIAIAARILIVFII